MIWALSTLNKTILYRMFNLLVQTGGFIDLVAVNSRMNACTPSAGVGL